MSRNSSNSTQLKVVISVCHRVDSELTRYRHEKGGFPKPTVRSNLSMEHLLYDVSVASYWVCNL